METEESGESATEKEWAKTRIGVVRDAAGIALASGVYAVSFGAISIAAGLSLLQTCALSVLMFTGASQFALVGVVGAGGAATAAAATAVLLGSRNALYSVRLSSVLQVGGLRRVLAAHLVIDESTAMAIRHPSARTARLGFWATGVLLFVCWNAGTLLGAVGAGMLPSPKVLGLDAAVPAAYLALLAPRLRSPETRTVALASAAVALASTPFVPTGLPVLLGALVAVATGLRPARGEDPASAPTGTGG